MEGQGNPFEETQSLAKGSLAVRIRDILDQPEIPINEKLKHIRGMVEYIIGNVPGHPPNKVIEGLAKKILASQVRDTLNEEGRSAESRAEEVRQRIERFIV